MDSSALTIKLFLPGPTTRIGKVGVTCKRLPVRDNANCMADPGTTWLDIVDM